MVSFSLLFKCYFRRQRNRSILYAIGFGHYGSVHQWRWRVSTLVRRRPLDVGWRRWASRRFGYTVRLLWNFANDIGSRAGLGFGQEKKREVTFFRVLTYIRNLWWFLKLCNGNSKTHYDNFKELKKSIKSDLMARISNYHLKRRMLH